MIADPLLSQGAVDRFKNEAYELVVDGESCRSRPKPSIDKDGPPRAAPSPSPSCYCDAAAVFFRRS